MNLSIIYLALLGALTQGAGMQVGLLVGLIFAAFALGACPFSVWVGRWLLKRDIRDFGDGNPGAWNVFRAGGRKAGWLALALDIAKGFSIVFVASSADKPPTSAVFIVALSAIIGHVLSPFLRFRGGKGVAVSYGVLLALPNQEILLLMAAFMLLGFLFLETRAWIVVLGPLGSLAFLGLTGGGVAALLFLLSILLIFVTKNHVELKAFPRYNGVLFQWVKAMRH